MVLMIMISSLLIILIFVVLLLVVAVKPKRSDLSYFELNRRSLSGDRSAKGILSREKKLNYVAILQQIAIYLLIILFTISNLAVFGWLIGVAVSVLAIIPSFIIARFGFVDNLANKLYEKLENRIFKLIKKMSFIFKIIRVDLGVDRQKLGSSFELQNLVNDSEGILSADQKNLIVNGLSFDDQIISTLMTPRDGIDSIDKSEFLGPLALNDLHKIGHDQLPVIDGDVDHIVGILYLKSLLTLDIKRSTTVEKAMDDKVYYIRDDQSLEKALEAFLKTRHNLLIVVNKSRETVGLLTLSDVIEALFGRKFDSEFDNYDNFRSVASSK